MSLTVLLFAFTEKNCEYDSLILHYTPDRVTRTTASAMYIASVFSLVCKRIQIWLSVLVSHTYLSHATIQFLLHYHCQVGLLITSRTK